MIEGHDQVLAAVRAAEPADRRAGRGPPCGPQPVIYVGAGTGGRLAAMDACEWGPTFGVSDDAVVALLAGEGTQPGSYEGEASEDDAAAGAAAMRALRRRRTTWWSGCRPAARRRSWSARSRRRSRPARRPRRDRAGGSPLAALVDLAIEMPVGAEVVSGSTG